MKARIRIAQEFLKRKGLYNGGIDGVADLPTMAAITRVAGIDQKWPKQRRLIAFIQIAAREHNIDSGPIDGLWGPITQAAFDQLTYLLEHGKLQPPWRPDTFTVPNPNNWPEQNTRAFENFYGPKGSDLVMVDFPFEMRLSWQLSTTVRRTTCHRKVAESLQRVLQKVKDIYGENEIKRLRLDYFGGCYNDRMMRNGNQWSMHAWGIALDFDPIRNQLEWGRDKASMAHPDYNDWWKCWEEEGWISLGRKRNFDWMHVQAARLPE